MVTVDGVVSNIGGCLGVFLGASFLTLAELLSFCFQSLFLPRRKPDPQSVCEKTTTSHL